VVLSRRDWVPLADRARSAEKRPRGKGQRRGLVGVSLIAGLVLAAALLPAASPWTSHPLRHDGAAQVGNHPGVTARDSSWR